MRMDMNLGSYSIEWYDAFPCWSCGATSVMVYENRGPIFCWRCATERIEFAKRDYGAEPMDKQSILRVMGLPERWLWKNGLNFRKP